ncbi:hypothetical protein Q5752_003750 [Cryptotrichosporon argae]
MWGSKLAALVALSTAVRAYEYDPYWIISHGALLTTRLDPILSPGGVSGHVHSILGTSSFKPVYDYENSRSGECTTANINIDKSSYWAPQLYRKYDNGSLGIVPMTYANTYEDEDIYEFPPGFRMMAGNPGRTTFNNSDPTNLAVNYTCLDYTAAALPQTAAFPEYNCPDGLRAQVYFPHCWDGQNLWLENSAHVAYGIDSEDPGGGSQCPDTHPYRLVGVFFEFIFQDDYAYEPGARVWSFGDDVGYGFHGDFTNGWPEGFFQTILSYGPACFVGFSLADCPALAPYVSTIGGDCNPEFYRVDEDIGYNANLTSLPGNNPIGEARSTNYVEEAEFTWAAPQIPGNWNKVGCIAEGSGGRALTADSTTSGDMSPDYCISFCAAAGYTYAGVEYGDECYCGDSFSNGASTDSLLATSNCSVPCAGALYGKGFCGGASTLTIYEFAGEGDVSVDAVTTVDFLLGGLGASPTQIAVASTDLIADTAPVATVFYSTTDLPQPTAFSAGGSGETTDTLVYANNQTAVATAASGSSSAVAGSTGALTSATSSGTGVLGSSSASASVSASGSGSAGASGSAAVEAASSVVSGSATSPYSSATPTSQASSTTSSASAEVDAATTPGAVLIAEPSSSSSSSESAATTTTGSVIAGTTTVSDSAATTTSADSASCKRKRSRRSRH